MFEMLVAALIQSLLLALGVGISLMIRVSVTGGLVVFGLTLVSSFFLFGGTAAGLSALFTLMLPAKQRKLAASFFGLLYFIFMSLYLFIEHKFPHLLIVIANVFIQPATNLSTSGHDVIWFIAAILFGLLLGVVPMGKAYGRILLQPSTQTETNARVDKPIKAPKQSTPFHLFLWRERIVLTRRRGALIGVLLGTIVLIILPQQMNNWAYAFLGVQIGATVLVLGPGKSIALLYLIPLPPSQLWRLRVLSLMPTASVVTVIFLLATGIHSHQLNTELIFGDITLTFAGLCGASFILMLNPSIFIAGNQGKRSFRSILLQSLMFSFAPIGLAELNSALPWPGIIVNLGIIIGIWFFGQTYLNTKSSVRYPLREGA